MTSEEQAKQIVRDGLCDGCGAIGCNSEDICDGFGKNVKTILKEWATEDAGKEMLKCFNWIKKLKVACPYCVAICEYDELIDKVKCENGEIIKCKKCNKNFILANDR